MANWKHKYIFYFYPLEGEKKGIFRILEHSKEGKNFAKKTKRKYDFKKLY